MSEKYFFLMNTRTTPQYFCFVIYLFFFISIENYTRTCRAIKWIKFIFQNSCQVWLKCINNKQLIPSSSTSWLFVFVFKFLSQSSWVKKNVLLFKNERMRDRPNEYKFSISREQNNGVMCENWWHQRDMTFKHVNWSGQ